MLKFVIRGSALAVPLFLAFAPVQAIAQARPISPFESYVHPQMSDEATKARSDCVKVAQKKKLSGDEKFGSPSPRYIVYADCVKGKGFLP